MVEWVVVDRPTSIIPALVHLGLVGFARREGSVRASPGRQNFVPDVVETETHKQKFTFDQVDIDFSKLKGYVLLLRYFRTE